MFVKVIKNFLSEKELEELNSWALDNYRGPFFVPNNMDHGYGKYRPTRLTTRGFGMTNAPLKYPEDAYGVQNKLKKYLDIENPMFPPPYFNGIVCGVGLNGGYIEKHKDPIFYKDTQTLHCIFKTQKSDSGGNTIIEEKEYDEVDENDLLMCVVSKYDHGASRIIGNTPRVLWYFGFCLSEEKLKKIFN